MIHHLREIIAAQKRGEAVGIAPVCSANPLVIEAALAHARKENRFVYIESTARQVNQDGGYARMTPQAFALFIRQISDQAKADTKKIILGGDHLGPAPWQSENAGPAMAKARDLVRLCVFAGYRKLHLDPTIPCRDDIRDGRSLLSLETIAERTASLCESAEAAAREMGEKQRRLVYVVGAEVPAPGGLRGEAREIRVSSVGNVEEMIHCVGRAFIRKGLEDAWNRCVAVVAETGAAFGPETIYDYDSQKTRALTRFIEKEKNIIFEAHSTDFQTESALCGMVRGHFAILKVGPCLTFAAREALYALAHIEREWLGERKEVTLSYLPDLMGKLMRENPVHWRDHYTGDAPYLNYITVYGFSDRIRYYWSHPECAAAVARLFQNLRQYGIPAPLLSQYLPDLYEGVREGLISGTPDALIQNKIEKILDKYANACGNGLTEKTI